MENVHPDTLHCHTVSHLGFNIPILHTAAIGLATWDCDRTWGRHRAMLLLSTSGPEAVRLLSHLHLHMVAPICQGKKDVVYSPNRYPLHPCRPLAQYSPLSHLRAMVQLR